jgi:phosphoglycolate phosphatase-like HAD superfamily hydrolase
VGYDAVVFDMDGVLLTGYHTPRWVYREATADALATLGVAGDAPRELSDPDDISEFRAACADLGVDPEAVWRHRERGADERETALVARGERTLFDDVDTLADLDCVGVVSNNRQGTVSFVVDFFDLPVAVARGRDPTLAGFERLKPDPYYLNLVVADLGVAPERTLFVGDRRSDVETARRAGTDAALLGRDGDPPDGDPEPDHYVATLAEIPALDCRP